MSSFDISTPLTLLTRPQCHLCEEAAATLQALDADFAAIDVDSSADLAERYGDRIPVLLAGAIEIASAPMSTTSLAAALRRFGIGRQATS